MNKKNFLAAVCGLTLATATQSSQAFFTDLSNKEGLTEFSLEYSQKQDDHQEIPINIQHKRGFRIITCDMQYGLDDKSRLKEAIDNPNFCSDEFTSLYKNFYKDVIVNKMPQEQWQQKYVALQARQNWLLAIPKDKTTHYVVSINPDKKEVSPLPYRVELPLDTSVANNPVESEESEKGIAGMTADSLLLCTNRWDRKGEVKFHPLNPNFASIQAQANHRICINIDVEDKVTLEKPLEERNGMYGEERGFFAKPFIGQFVEVQDS